jgi:hypothetical protein
LAIIAALDDVLRDMGQVESWLAGHGGFRAGGTPVFLRNRVAICQAIPRRFVGKCTPTPVFELMEAVEA